MAPTDEAGGAAERGAEEAAPSRLCMCVCWLVFFWMVRLLVGWLVGLSVIISLKGGKFHLNAPIGAHAYLTSTVMNKVPTLCSLVQHNQFSGLFGKCNLPMTPPVRLLVGWMIVWLIGWFVGLSVLSY